MRIKERVEPDSMNFTDKSFVFELLLFVVIRMLLTNPSQGLVCKNIANRPHKCPDYEVRYCCDANQNLNENWIQLPANFKQHAGWYNENLTLDLP